MKETNLTEWFPEETKPIRDGVYQTKSKSMIIPSKVGYSFWFEGSWSGQYKDRYRAVEHKDIHGYQDKEWRGLKEPA